MLTNTKIVLLTVVVFLATMFNMASSVNAQTNDTATNQTNSSSSQSTDTGYTYKNYLTDFSYGQVGMLENGTTTRDFTLMLSENTLVPVTTDGNNGTLFPGWTYNGTIPAPTLRMTEGDHVSITVVNPSISKQPHSMHMHSVHHPIMDGTYGPSAQINPGQNFTYTFIAKPAGLYPYHCHVAPIIDHINRGLYGAMIIDPPMPRAPANEMVMMLNSYDFDLNEEANTYL